MKRKLLIAAIVAAGVAGPLLPTALATPSGIEPNHPNHAGESENCVGTISAAVRHNGHNTTLGQGGDPSHGKRGQEVQGAQDTCGAHNR